MSAKPKAIELISGKLTRKTVRSAWQQGDGKFDLDERDNPLPALAKSLLALVPVVTSILHVHDVWGNDLRIIGVKMGEQGGAATVQIMCRKSISDAAKEFDFITPYRLLAHPSEPGTYTEPLTDARAALVWEVVEQFKNYIRGDRAQGQIEFEGEDDDDADGAGAGKDGDKTDPLLFPAPEEKSPATPKSPAKKRAAKKK